MSAELVAEQEEESNTADIKQNKPSKSKWIDAGNMFFGGALTLAGLMVADHNLFGDAGYIRVRTLIGKTIAGHQETPEPPLTSSDVRKRISGPVLTNTMQRYLSDYEEWQNPNKKIQSLLEEEIPIEDIGQIVDKMSTHFLIDGINLMQTSYLTGLTNTRVNADYIRGDLFIDDEHYDLKNRYEKQQASVWIQTKAMQLNGELMQEISKAATENEDNPTHAQLQKDLEQLTWLKERNLPITFEDDSFSFFPREELVQIARVYQDIDRLYPDLINRATWCKRDCLEFMSKDAGGVTSMYSKSIEMQNLDPSDTLTHELGHLIAIKIGANEKMAGIRGFHGQAPNEDGLSYVRNYALTDENEDFAETFREYLVHGDRFRTRIDFLNRFRPVSAEMLQKKYDLVKEVLSGNEYSDEAMPRDLMLEQKSKEFADIDWIDQDTLAIHANPDAWPERTNMNKLIPYIENDEIKWIATSLRFDTKNDVYKFWIAYADKVPTLKFYPMPYTNRIGVTSEQKSFSPSLFGYSPEMAVNLEPLDENSEDKYKSTWVTINNIKPVKKEQERVVFDNDKKNPGINLRNSPDDESRTRPKVYNGDKILVIDGPRDSYYPYTRSTDRFWRVYSDGDIGWISERWLGKEVR